MKTIHAIFTDEEYEKIVKKKNISELNWHDFILLVGTQYKKEDKDGKRSNTK